MSGRDLWQMQDHQCHDTATPHPRGRPHGFARMHRTKLTNRRLCHHCPVGLPFHSCPPRVPRRTEATTLGFLVCNPISEAVRVGAGLQQQPFIYLSSELTPEPLTVGDSGSIPLLSFPAQ